MKGQINQEKSQTFPNANLDRLGKTAGYLQLRSFTDFLPRSYNEILRVARLGWFPRTNWPLYGAGPRPRKICQPWNVKFCQSETGWLFGQIKRSFNPGFCGSSQFSMNFALTLGLSTIKNNQFATPTLGEPRQVVDAPRIWLRQVGKLAARIDGFRMSTIYKLQVSFLFTESHILSLGLKCTDRSRWSLSTVTSGHSRTSILGASTFVRVSCTTSLSLGKVPSLIGYPHQNRPRTHFMQHFSTSLPDWYLPAEWGMVHWRKSTFACCSQLKSLQASYFFRQIWTFECLWTAFSSCGQILYKLSSCM